MNKRALLENLTPEQRGALIGSMVGAGGMGLAGAMGSKKNKLRNSLLAALAGGAGGAGLGYFAPGLMGQGEAKEQAGPPAPAPGEREMVQGKATRDDALKGIENTLGQAKGPQLGAGLPKQVGGGGFNAPVPLDDVQKNILGQMSLGRLPGLGGR